MLLRRAFTDASSRFIVLAFGSVLTTIALTGCGHKQDARSHRSEATAPRTWRSEQLGFEVTIPSERWEKRTNPNVLALFGASDFAATIAEARPIQSDSEWQGSLQFAKGMRTEKAANVEEKSGANPNGHDFWLYVGDVQEGSKSYFLGVSTTRIPGRAVIMMFEGKPQSDSHVAAMQRAQAIQFLSSVK